jgi:hypothetical protein
MTLVEKQLGAAKLPDDLFRVVALLRFMGLLLAKSGR